jgi:hypothetical protein
MANNPKPQLRNRSDPSRTKGAETGQTGSLNRSVDGSRPVPDRSDGFTKSRAMAAEQCPECHAPTRLDAGRIVCGFTAYGTDWSCGWTGPPVIKLAAPA